MFLILSIQFNGESRALRLQEEDSFEQLANSVYGMWPQFDRTNFENFRYSVGPITNCVLKDQDDLTNLFAICKHTEKLIVNLAFSKAVRELVSSNNSVIQTPLSINSTEYFEGNQLIESHIFSANDHTLSSVSPKKSVPKQTKIPFRSIKKFKPLVEKQSLNIHDSPMPTYDICPFVERKALLSDGWENIMAGGIGSVFRDGAVGFRRDLIKHATQLGFSFRYVRNNLQYIHVECIEKESLNCQWHIKARCLNYGSSFEVYKGDFCHCCLGNNLIDRKKRFGPKIIGKLVQENVVAYPDITGSKVVDLMRIYYGITIPYYKGWRTAQAAREFFFGGFNESYDQLRWYRQAVLKTNPGSVFDLDVNNVSNCFERVFISFKACLDGFRSCRPILFIDGTFLRGLAKGVLLTATAKDGNNGLYPVAFAVVSAENTENWQWFLTKTLDNCIHTKEVCYISDRNSGLMAAFPLVFNKPSHFFCLWHLLLNLRVRFAGSLRKKKRARMAELFRDAAYAPNIRLFEIKLSIFKEAGGKISDEWLSHLPFEKWVCCSLP